MDEWTEIRKRVLIGGASKRAILRETGMHWLTLEKILAHSEPPGYRQSQPRRKPKIGPFEKRIEQWLVEDREMPRKQRHTAKRIWERLRDEEDYEGGYTAVKDTVRRLRETRQEVFLPLKHVPGEAQVDFGHALARINGRLRKVPFFVMTLPHSDAVFVAAFERECTETFWEGHVRAFEFFGAVPTRISYDNSRIAVAQVMGRERRLTVGFRQLQSHYLFEEHFCRVARGNEKGGGGRTGEVCPAQLHGARAHRAGLRPTQRAPARMLSAGSPTAAAGQARHQGGTAQRGSGRDAGTAAHTF